MTEILQSSIDASNLLNCYTTLFKMLITMQISTVVSIFALYVFKSGSYFSCCYLCSYSNNNCNNSMLESSIYFLLFCLLFIGYSNIKYFPVSSYSMQFKHFCYIWACLTVFGFIITASFLTCIYIVHLYCLIFIISLYIFSVSFIFVFMIICLPFSSVYTY